MSDRESRAESGKRLDFFPGGLYFIHCKAGIAQLAERHLAKVEVAGPNPVSRSIFLGLILEHLFYIPISEI